MAINSFYSTAFLAATGLSGRNLFGYLIGYVQGAGSLALSAVLPGSVASAALGAWTLGSPASRDMEQFTNVLAERVSYQVGTNAVGAWFALTKLVPWAKPDPFAVARHDLTARIVCRCVGIKRAAYREANFTHSAVRKRAVQSLE